MGEQRETDSFVPDSEDEDFESDPSVFAVVDLLHASWNPRYTLGKNLRILLTCVSQYAKRGKTDSSSSSSSNECDRDAIALKRLLTSVHTALIRCGLTLRICDRTEMCEILNEHLSPALHTAVVMDTSMNTMRFGEWVERIHNHVTALERERKREKNKRKESRDEEEEEASTSPTKQRKTTCEPIVVEVDIDALDLSLEPPREKEATTAAEIVVEENRRSESDEENAEATSFSDRREIGANVSKETRTPPRESSASRFDRAADFDDIFEENSERNSANRRFAQTISTLNRGELRTVRTPGEEGSQIVKLQVYDCKDVMTLNPRNWWKRARLRAQLLLSRTESDDSKKRLLREFIQRSFNDLNSIPETTIDTRFYSAD